jgi:5S rRNA maturation endonuclease (ribonuclease M5)
VRALDVVVQIGGRQDETAVRRLHHCGSIIATASAMTLQQG